jgi:hypothetical protein
MGSVSRQTHVVFPPPDAFEIKTPFAITVSPCGTVTLKSYVA